MYIRADNMCQYGGGQVVSMLDFYSDDPSSNPLKPTVFSVKFVLEKTENKQKEAVVCPFFLKKTRANRRQCESIFQRERLLQFPRERTVF